MPSGRVFAEAVPHMATVASQLQQRAGPGSSSL
jgi:hypothetical protein